MQLTLLGTGGASQVPVYNCACPACTRARREPAYRRGPCSALVECDGQRWLLDSGLTDLAERFTPGSLAGILQTHYHADHCQGLLHLRWGLGLRIPVHGPDDPEGFADLYKHPGILDFSEPFAAFERRPLGALTVTALPLVHSKPTFGYLLEGDGRRIAYLTDTLGLPDRTREFLQDIALDVLVLDCSTPPRDMPPRNHNDLSRALQTVEALQPAQAVLTHIGHELDAWFMQAIRDLPGNVRLAQDGMKL
ncbi:phosphonate metabolism protein PhnP [Pseudomonas oligotrophica]|uniref:phosphonate metabolism protein PhnP n=1 Tax=Pseudomonas oligotrophica TaxID=2912055 RepID=UPI001F003FE9|nr:phosphonate metabolism protein PhnP [Pseudomonas oligotrophica]MCF7200731.1 phosphonate metabolism protein PhnP [Pseudomonas oligotrophica]